MSEGVRVAADKLKSLINAISFYSGLRQPNVCTENLEGLDNLCTVLLTADGVYSNFKKILFSFWTILDLYFEANGLSQSTLAYCSCNVQLAEVTSLLLI